MIGSTDDIYQQAYRTPLLSYSLNFLLSQLHHFSQRSSYEQRRASDAFDTILGVFGQ